jgi:GNAT superfamily N-acetyltransferase
MEAILRTARPDDLEALAKVCYRAFRDVAERHGFPPDFDSVESARAAFASFLTHPLTYGVAVEKGGRVVGSAFVHDRSPVATVGPVTVDPDAQDAGVGRSMMEAVLEWARRGEFPSIRLVQSAYHVRSLALYAGLGFDAKESLCCLQGPAIDEAVPGCRVRLATPGDVAACNVLCRQVHGFDRGFELARGVERGVATVVERGGRVTGYASEVAFWGHAVADTNQDLTALIAAASAFGGPGFLMPTRNTELLRGCLARGLRIVQPMTLMSIGWYQEPGAPYLPSVGF